MPSATDLSGPALIDSNLCVLILCSMVCYLSLLKKVKYLNLEIFHVNYSMAKTSCMKSVQTLFFCANQ